jgi:hypothetical protein
MIKINNHIKETSCKLYNNDDIFIGRIKNQLAFIDVKAQIKQQRLSGYYIVFEGKSYRINSDGVLMDKKPEGLFDLTFKMTVDFKNMKDE